MLGVSDEVVDIALADDHALFRDGLRHILEANPTFRIVGEAADSDAAIALVATAAPDVLLLDVQMRGADVLATVRRIREIAPRCNIVVLTMYDDAQLLTELLMLGIRGYLLKSVSWRELVSAISSIHTDPTRVILSVSPRTVTRASTHQSIALSPRELEVLKLTAQAMSNGQIAKRLALTEATVKRHLRNIFGKLGAVSRLDAVNKARLAGLISSESAVPTARAVAPARTHAQLAGSGRLA
jgi:DNA-binding NarL/FixJ family response regulator